MEDSSDGGLRAVFLANRQVLLRFLTARGAREDAEDLLHEVWLRIERGRPGPVAAPLSYLYRVANTVMIDRFRSSSQARARERDWADANSGAVAEISDSPSPERVVAARQSARLLEEALAALPARAAALFQRTRIDGLTQREAAREFGVSVSTVESDLRLAYRIVATLRDRIDEE